MLSQGGEFAFVLLSLACQVRGGGLEGLRQCCCVRPTAQQVTELALGCMQHGCSMQWMCQLYRESLKHIVPILVW